MRAEVCCDEPKPAAAVSQHVTTLTECLHCPDNRLFFEVRRVLRKTGVQCNSSEGTENVRKPSRAGNREIAGEDKKDESSIATG